MRKNFDRTNSTLTLGDANDEQLQVFPLRILHEIVDVLKLARRVHFVHVVESHLGVTSAGGIAKSSLDLVHNLLVDSAGEQEHGVVDSLTRKAVKLLIAARIARQLWLGQFAAIENDRLRGDGDAEFAQAVDIARRVNGKLFHLANVLLGRAGGMAQLGGLHLRINLRLAQELIAAQDAKLQRQVHHIRTTLTIDAQHGQW